MDSDASSLVGSDFGFDASELNDDDFAPIDQDNFLSEYTFMESIKRMLLVLLYPSNFHNFS